ncbi:hypothetical protein QBC36DRAFT_175624 [Triangularia setosa]|uniref:C2H2-type domain-containing protein n=1 Tax=Triangularia setosa TaxID=2587417 RepID=A0AAN6WJG0_9PEZI|nr:hypothetical protein QBC36DRAFT_175624 [Podospora setosa]
MRRPMSSLFTKSKASPEPAEPSGTGTGQNTLTLTNNNCSNRASPSASASSNSPSSLNNSSSRSPSLTPQPATPKSPTSGLFVPAPPKSHFADIASLPPQDPQNVDFDFLLDCSDDVAASAALSDNAAIPTSNTPGIPDIDMATGPVFDSGLGRSRQDSFVGARPISMANPNRTRRDSNNIGPGSLMGGMSWGGISLGSFVKDEMMMTGTSPYPTHQSPSYHSSSYIPKLEASFMRDFICCDTTWDTLHDLLQHYEEQHTTMTGASTLGPGFGGSFARGPTSRAASVAPSARPQQPTQPMHGFQQQRQAGTGASNLGVGGFGQMMRQQAAPAAPKVNHMSHLNDEMDAVGDMEMDDPVGHMDMDDSQRIQQTRHLFGQQQRPHLHLNASVLPHQALRTSQPPTPAAQSFGFQNNPTVSSVNTPTLTTHQGLPQRGQQFSQDNTMEEDDDMSGLSMPMKLNTGNMAPLGGFPFNLNNTIDDPAKRLFSPGGSSAQMTSQQRAMEQQLQIQQQVQQQLSTMNLDFSQLPPGVDPNTILQHFTALIMPPAEEHKPFKCPVIGCEKAYKNQNGLKYHKTHGHSTQQLHENGDGTFSIVNPETHAPYPGTLGMEKEKPFKCEVCGKRYKNLNGLKYHKQHSPACDPEIRAQHQNILSTMMQNPAGFIAMQQNLPNINEDNNH